MLAFVKLRITVSISMYIMCVDVHYVLAFVKLRIPFSIPMYIMCVMFLLNCGYHFPSRCTLCVLMYIMCVNVHYECYVYSAL